MKKILGLDLGTNSIGWALVNEAENVNEKSNIIKLGVRVNPLTVDEKTDFEKGRPLSVNADRTLKRGARRNLQRFKLRRTNLLELLLKNNIIQKDTVLTETGKNTTYQTLKLRSLAPKEKITLNDFAKVLLAINKKRGYKSSRKANNEEEGNAIDGMAIAKELFENNLTPGQFVFKLLDNGKKYIPDFYRSDLQKEFSAVWNHQKKYYQSILTDTLFKDLQNKNKSQTWAICKDPFQIVGVSQKGTTIDKRKQKYEWRTLALNQQLDLETLAIVLQEINNDLNKSSGYLGAISDRSKELYFNKETVGQNLYEQIKNNPHTSLKNQVFYRQDYLDEFERIWETQTKYHKILTSELKEEIRDVVIFYQRKLKSQKGLLSFCQFESWQQTYTDEISKTEKKRTIGQRVVPKSSPIFQEFKIWANLNILEFTNKLTKERIVLDDDSRLLLFEELNLRGKFTESAVLKFLGLKSKEWKTNFPTGIEGNNTNQTLYNIYQQIAENEGYGFDWAKKTAREINEELTHVFKELNINPDVLTFDTNAEDTDKQASFQLWHLLYSAEDDGKISEQDKVIYGDSNVALKKVLENKFGFNPTYGSLLANASLQKDYGNLSSRAIKKITPFLRAGNNYADACTLAGYNHSNSRTKEENEKRTLAPHLELLKKNSLRNPVVEKIINQMVNVINQVIDTYGKPDEIRIELARELKKSAKQRADMTSYINKATKANDDIKKLITKDFGIPNPTKNDVVRYKLWEELSVNKHNSLFTNQYIPKEKIFSSEIDIEHIIPKAVMYDDSFSNKTLAYRNVNLKKGKRLALDFITEDYNADLDNYISRVESLYKKGKGTISKGKYKKLLTRKETLKDGFTARDLKNTQYIAKKAKEMLEDVFRTVIPVSGGITDKLREDWDLINVMKELNFPKYKALGLTEIEIRKNNKQIEVIKDWTKRNDHRHHAMDALTVAFTSYNHIQYINNLEGSSNKTSNLYQIKNTITKLYPNGNDRKKRKFVPPIENFRTVAKIHLEGILISFKTKNKVVTKNKNYIKGQSKPKIQLTPRGQLHKETVYAKQKRAMVKPLKLSKKFSLKNAMLIIDSSLKELVLIHLKKHQNNPLVAFDSKTLKKDPLFFKGEPLKEALCFEEIYTIRKDITPDLKIEKVIDQGVKEALKTRLKAHNNNPKEAFSNLDKNPIWLNKSAGIAIKRVRITGVSNAEALHFKKDHFGKAIFDAYGNKQATDFISTGNNHHVAIYKDDKGKLQEKVVSFYEAVARVNEGLSVIDKTHNEHLGWEFLFTMKQNELFIFPSDDFNPLDYDLLNPENAGLISKHLFRVQKISTKNYMFTNHLETISISSETLKTKKELASYTYNSIRSTDPLRNIIKIRTNHLGNIVSIGEY